MQIQAADEPAAGRALVAAWQALSAIEALMHPTRPGSDLCRVNAAAAGATLALDARTGAVLRLARRLCQLTDGRFDPALPGRGTVMDLRALPSGHWHVRAPLQLDLGGIAKGAAVDAAVRAARRSGALAGLVNAGGDLRAFGPRAWPVHVRVGGRLLGPIALREGAVAVSERGVPEAPPGHRGHYGPRHAPRADDPHAVAVHARTAALADAMTKVFLQLPPGSHRPLERAARATCLAFAGAADQPGRTCPEPRTTYL